MWQRPPPGFQCCSYAHPLVHVAWRRAPRSDSPRPAAAGWPAACAAEEEPQTPPEEPPANDEGELPAPTEEEQAKLDFFNTNHNARKAAYGRLATAVEKYDGPLKDQLLQQYNESQTPGVANRWAKARQMLEEWVLDPSFGRSV